MTVRRFIEKHRLRLLVVLLATGMVCAGCGTEPENTSEKPWDSPEGWQNGNLPPQMTQPR